jgi:diguanylate cyclase (GGDEF)-like protein
MERLAAREAAVERRELALDSREALLRDANEHLVVATVQAQAMTEVAQQATAQMSYLAQHDVLTDLPNRALLKDRLAQALDLARRHHRCGALLFLDVDHFKPINDALGHQAGDELLQSIARRLLVNVRRSDTVSRQGGDEFVVLLAEVAGVQDAVGIADHLIRAMAEPHLVSGQRLNVSLSIGISLFPDDGEDAETLLRNADAAMFQAKKAGRGGFLLYSPPT